MSEVKVQRQVAPFLLTLIIMKNFKQVAKTISVVFLFLIIAYVIITGLIWTEKESQIEIKNQIENKHIPKNEPKKQSIEIKQKKEKTKEETTPKKISLGEWDHTLGDYFYGTIVILEENGRFYFEKQYKDGSKTVKNLIKKDRKFFIEDNKFGEYFVIEENGNLGLYDEEGKFAEAASQKILEK